MTCKNKFVNFINYSLPVLLTVLIIGYLSDPYYDRNSLIKKRRIYQKFKNATMSIIIKEWEKSHYDFKKLKKVTYILNVNENAIYCFVLFGIILNFFFLKINFNSQYLKLLGFIINNPFWGIVSSILIVNCISYFIPVIDTEKILLLTISVNLIEKIYYLNINNINYYIDGFFRRTN